MPVETLREALRLVRSSPALWLLGVAIAGLGTLNLYLQLFAGIEPTRFGLIQLFVVPFLIGGGIHAVHRGGGAISAFVEGGKQYYWRVLLATLVILFGALLTIILLMVGVGLMGLGSDTGMLGMIAMGVAVPFLCFTYFYDTAIVIEERKALDSIRRSVEFVFAKPLRVLLFFVLNLAILIALALLASILLAAIIAPFVEPASGINATELNAIAVENLVKDLGTLAISGLMLVWFLALTLGVVIVYAYKVAFFRRYAVEERMQYGVYDEKGRWFKY